MIKILIWGNVVCFGFSLLGGFMIVIGIVFIGGVVIVLVGVVLGVYSSVVGVSYVIFINIIFIKKFIDVVIIL